ncbi:MAG TPA: rod-binding protein [Bryobacteraceae bacterium]|nr:rod-binding protein [Bryobacteraceae bacterium]
MTNSIASVPADALSVMAEPKPAHKSATAAGAAQQFEALLLGQMLRSAHESGEDDDADSSSDTMRDVANQQFAQLMAKNGGVGIAKMIVKGLEP